MNEGGARAKVYCLCESSICRVGHQDSAIAPTFPNPAPVPTGGVSGIR